MLKHLYLHNYNWILINFFILKGLREGKKKKKKKFFAFFIK